METANKLQKLIDSGWTQQEIAAKTEIAQSSISRYMNGKREPRISDYRAIMALRAKRK